MDAFYSWLLVATLVVATLGFFMASRLRSFSWWYRGFLALLAVAGAMMTLLAVAVTLTEGPRAWAPEDGRLLVKAFLVVLVPLLLALVVSRKRSRAASAGSWNAPGEDPFVTTREGKPPRKRSCLLDGLGCVLVGGLGFVALVFAIGALTILAP